jgi:hypothetical protein
MDESPTLDPIQVKKASILKHASELRNQYALNSRLQQSLYRKVQIYILILGIIVTVLVITQTFLKTSIDLYASIDVLRPWLKNLNPWLQDLIIIIPIIISILVAISTFFRFGNKWVNLRTAAETLKSEIYQFRTNVGKYNTVLTPTNEPVSDPGETLFQQIQTISNQLMSSEVALGSLNKYDDIPPKKSRADGSEDDGYSDLSSDDYLHMRINDQIGFYQRRTRELHRNLIILQIFIFVGGGVGTFVAAIGLELWVTLTTTFVSVFTIYLQYNQVENTLLKYNQALNGLTNIKVWWSSLGENERNDIKNRDKLVISTEQILMAEHQSWVQNMKLAVSKVHELPQKNANGK